jgi:signal transduction histidine kinase/CheY-like chemotaxis protein
MKAISFNPLWAPPASQVGSIREESTVFAMLSSFHPARLLQSVLPGVALLFAVSLQAQPLSVDADTDRIAVGPYLEYYEDPSASLGIEDMLDPGFSVNFLPWDDDLLNFGITSSAFWARFELDWSNAGEAEKIIEFGPPKIVSGIARGGIDLFVVSPDNRVLRQYTLGTHQDDRELKTLRRGFALQIDADYGSQIYMRVTSARPLRLPITLWNINSFQQQQVQDDTLLGWQYGILFAMIFYNLFLYTSIRESSYLHYVFMISAQAAFLFLDSKHLRYLLNQEYQSSWLVDMSERWIYPLMVITAILFQRALLRIPDFNPRLDRVMQGFIIGFAIIALLALIPDEKLHQYPLILLLSLAIPLAFYSNYDALQRGESTALMHMVGIGVFLAGTVILMLLQLVPAFPNNAFTVNAYSIGLVAQALLMSLSLALRYNQIKQEKEDAQQQAIHNLVRSEQIKDDLLANVSHELRTPLYGINGLAETALAEFENRHHDRELVARNLELIRASGDRLTKLVNDLLDFSAAREEATYVKFKPVDLNSVITLVMAVCKPLIGEKSIELRAEVDPDLPLVAGDEDRLQQILVNLTSNAIKFTYAGEVVISAELSSEYNVTVKVKDTGIGIHKTDHETIFKTFEKLPSANMNASGIGLGLPLAKRMIEMHRSSLKLESELDMGSTFSFDLRVSLDQTRAVKSPDINKQMIRRADYLAEANEPEQMPRLRSEQETTILVVDDDEINRVVMGQQLEEYNVVKCSNGLDALTIIDEEKPDLVLLDLMMPGLNGYDVCQKLRQKYNQIELPIILVTAKNHLEDLTQGFRTGANDYLAKPFHNEELRSRVENQLRLSMLHRISEDNTKLRSQIESYAAADSELRSSRLRLQQVLETIQAGFIAFELPGRIFTFNQRATELLGTDRQSLEDNSILSLLSDSDSNEAFRQEIERWEADELDSDDDADNSIHSRSFKLELVYPYNSADKPSSKTVEFNCRLKLFAQDEGTGVLFLEDSEPLNKVSDSGLAQDTVELVSYLGQAQQNIRRIGTRLNVMTPSELSEYPQLLDKLSGIEELVNFIDEKLPSVSSEGEYRQQLVTLMRSALHTWEVTTQKSKIELAEESNIWAVSIDDGRLRTRTFDRYLRLEQLPKIPRWREVIRTAYFVLSNPSIEQETRQALEAELEKTKAILKKAAIS